VFDGLVCGCFTGKKPAEFVAKIRFFAVANQILKKNISLCMKCNAVSA
jgi:hypothetical protein